jgi:hypothetical protein
VSISERVAYGDLVNAENIPGDNIYPESVAAAATAFSTAGTAVPEKGSAVLTQWQGLGGVYTAPESAELLAIMDPVAVDTAAIGTTLTSVSTIISNFADTIDPIKTRLMALKVEANAFATRVINGVTVEWSDKDHPAWDAGIFSFVVTDFADMAPVTIPWDQHRDTVEENKDIIARINTEVAALDAAQVEAINAINALRTDDDRPTEAVVALTEDDLNAEGAVLPYGAATDGDKGCYQSVNDGMESAIVGMGEGAGALFGYNATTGDWGDGETAAAAWRGMGMTVAGVALLGNLGMAATLIPDEHIPSWLKGADDFAEEAMDHVTNAGKALVAVDMWSENPAEAFGTTLVNVGTFFIPGGAVVGGLKAGTVAARAASIAGHAADFVLPGASVASRVVTGSAVRAGTGLTGLTNALKGSLTSGVSAGRGALAQTLNSLGDSMPSVRVEPGHSVSLPGGGAMPGPGRIVIGEPGSGGDMLHRLAERVDPGTTPATSGTSGTPGTPGTPATSGTSGTPATPATSDTSGTPVTSGTQATSGTPARSGLAETPGTTGTPDASATSATPDAGTKPGASGASGAGNTRPAAGGAMDAPADAPPTSANPAQTATDGTPPTTADAAPGGAAASTRPAGGGAADAAATSGAVPAPPGAAGSASTNVDATVDAAGPTPDAAPADTSSASTASQPAAIAVEPTSKMADGTLRTPAFTDDAVGQGQQPFDQAMPAILERHGVTDAQFTRVAQEPLVNLSRPELQLVHDVSKAVPSPSATPTLQKVITFSDASAILNPLKESMERIKGFVSRPVDLLGMSNRQKFDVLGLGYTKTPFLSDLRLGRAFYDIRFDAPTPSAVTVPDGPLRFMLGEVKDPTMNMTDPVAKAQAIKDQWAGYEGAERKAMLALYGDIGYDLGNALDPKNPFRGSGLSGTQNGFSPEGTLGRDGVPVPNGAELWRTLPNGEREFMAVYEKPNPKAPGTWLLTDAAVQPGLMDGIAPRPTAGVGATMREND